MITVVGSANYDFYIKCEHFPIPGETILASDFLTSFGGKGANQAIAISRLGGEVRFIGCLSNDIFGKQLFNNFQNYKVSTDFIKIAENVSSGLAFINLNNTGENIIIVFPGANLKLTVEDVKSNKHIIEKSYLIMTQLEIQFDIIFYLIEFCHKNNIPLVLNASPAPRANDFVKYINGVDFLIVNEIEAGQISGYKYKGISEINEICEFFISNGVKNLIITLGEQGAFFYTNKGYFRHVPGYSIEVQDTAGAGDAFAGGFVYYFSVYKDIETAVRYANAVAALCIGKIGTQSSLPSNKEVLNFLILRKGI